MKSKGGQGILTVAQMRVSGFWSCLWGNTLLDEGRINAEMSLPKVSGKVIKNGGMMRNKI